MVLALFRPKTTSDRPQAVLALADSAYAEDLATHLRSAGWHVHVSENAGGARKLTSRVAPAVVVLSANLSDETGYLACSKIQKGKHKPRVLLVADEVTSGKKEFAAYVGATDCLAAGIGARAIAAKITSLMPAVA